MTPATAQELLACLKALDHLRADCAPDELGAIAGQEVQAFVTRYRAAIEAAEALTQPKGDVDELRGKIERALVLLEEPMDADDIGWCRRYLTDALGASPQQPKPDEGGKLKADFVRSLPSGMDDSTYEQIEDALDRADAPMNAADGRWLKLHERVAMLAAPKPDRAGGV